ncbi:MAG: ABC transporter substrate-binding protein [Eubacteriales bacterium]|nr:ABC transporter substrate-binding protein [Eubacteriales bacterium]
MKRHLKALAFALALSFLPSFGAALHAEEASASEAKTRQVVDDAGREVEIPLEIQSVAPSGGVATLVLFTAAPEKLAAVSRSFSKPQLKYLDKKYADLPEIGQFYGKKANLNLEELLRIKPDLIIDIGEKKKTVKEDMDGIQEQTGIPTLFIEALTPEMGDAYRKLGKILGNEERCENLAKYCEASLARSAKVLESLTDADKKTVYWAMGDAGLNTNALGSFQSEILDLVGADNVCKAEPVSRGGGTEVSMEDVLQWKPEYVLVDSPSLAETMAADPAWQDFFSQNPESKQVLVPYGPYGFLAGPPSVNRFIGLAWLGQLLYPEKYELDVRQEVKEFYELFYQVELTDEALDELLAEGSEAPAAKAA